MAERETYYDSNTSTVSVCWKDGSVTRRTPGGRLFTVWPPRRRRLEQIRRSAAAMPPRGSSSGSTRSS